MLLEDVSGDAPVIKIKYCVVFMLGLVNFSSVGLIACMHCGVTEFNLNRDKERKALVASGGFHANYLWALGLMVGRLMCKTHATNRQGQIETDHQRRIMKGN